MTATIIRVNNLTYTYPGGKKPALYNINLKINKGEFVGIMGPNGAGKTTLCLCLNGIIPHYMGGDFEGDVIIRNSNTRELRVADVSHMLGTVFQDPETQLTSVTVLDEVAFILENIATPREEILKRIEWALEAVRMKGFEERAPYELSGGEKQQVAIAAAIAMQPAILVLDEPTSNLDPIGTLKVFSVVKELNKKYGTTIVMVEHKSEELAEFADRIILLDKGNVAMEGNPHEIFQHKEVIQKVGVRAPQVSEVTYYLIENGIKVDEIPITLEEGISFYKKLLGEVR